MSKAVAYLTEAERLVIVSVIDCEDPGTPCRCCGATGPVYSVHCWREEGRPIVALCRECKIERAGGTEGVYIRSDRLGLRAGFATGKRPQLSVKQQAQRIAASKQRLSPRH